MEAILSWLRGNLLDVVQTLAIVVSLFISISVLRKSVRASRLDAIFEIAASHRELWLSSMNDPELSRVTEANVDISAKPPSFKEKMFVVLLVSHLNSVYEANQSGLLCIPSTSYSDFAGFFSLPIPALIWNEIKQFQNPDFVKFVEKGINSACGERNSFSSRLKEKRAILCEETCRMLDHLPIVSNKHLKKRLTSFLECIKRK